MSNLIKNITEFALYLVQGYISEGDVVVDATCGNGYDTLRLAQLSPAKLYAFDIQQEAVDATRKRLREAGFAEKLKDGAIEVICDSHEHLTDHVKTFIQAAVFNLGYLPGGDHGVFTTPGVSVPAMRTALELLRPGGVMTVCVYYGGPQGMAEKDAVLAFLTGLRDTRPIMSATETAYIKNTKLYDPRLHRKAGLVNGRRVPCDTAAFLCRAPMVSPFFHTRMIVLSHPWPILKATSGKKEDVDL